MPAPSGSSRPRALHEANQRLRDRGLSLRISLHWLHVVQGAAVATQHLRERGLLQWNHSIQGSTNS